MEKLKEERSKSKETVIDDSKLKEQAVREDDGQSAAPLCTSTANIKSVIQQIGMSHLFTDHANEAVKPETSKKRIDKSQCPATDSSVGSILVDNQFDSTDIDDDQESVSGEFRAPSLTAATENEGDFFDDYMQFLIRPFEAMPPALSSTISSSDISCVEPVLQRTIAIVKPEAMEFSDAILRAVIQAGFQIIGMRLLHLTPEQVSEIYLKHYGSITFPLLVISVSSEPVLALSLASLNAIDKWKKIIGDTGTVREDWFYPISVRARFGLHPAIEDALHASQNLEASDRENRYLFPDSILEPLMTDEGKVTDYCNLYINPVLVQGLTKVVKCKPIDPVIFLAEWLLNNNPFQPRLPRSLSIVPT